MTSDTTALHPNLIAYDGVEAAGNFADPAAIVRYRAALLERSRPQAAYISRHLGKNLDVLEAAAGNGRLGFALTECGAARSYLGVELSESRVGFARDWNRETGGAVRVEHGDLFAYQSGGSYDLIACLTGAFAYFDPIRRDGARHVLRILSDACRPGGHVLLELYMHPARKARCLAVPEHAVREWDRLATADPFEYYLHEYTFDPASSWLTHHKIFVPRDLGRCCDVRTEVLRLYSAAEVTELLAGAGLTVHRMDATWDGQPYVDGAEVLIVVARKAA